MASRLQRWFGRTAEVPLLDNWSVRCHPICVGEFSVFQSDLEQKQELRAFSRLATRSMQFLDIGTHWGVFTLAALYLGGPKARVIAIEASREAAGILRDNLLLNAADEHVTIINAACSETDGQIQMLTTGAGGAGYYVPTESPRSDSISVPSFTADTIVAHHSFCPTHMKVDVEGCELEVLQGAKSTLANHRPILFLELHGDLLRKRQRSPEEVLRHLTKLGYRHWEGFDGRQISLPDLASARFNVRFVARYSA
ncbi:MAG: FkbM family methyltransferase [Nitrospira sp.]